MPALRPASTRSRTNSSSGQLGRSLQRGHCHAYPPHRHFGRFQRRRGRRPALGECAILRALLTVPIGLAVLRGGCDRGRRRDACDRAVLAVIGSAALRLRILRDALLPQVLWSRILSVAVTGLLLRAAAIELVEQKVWVTASP